MFRREGRVEREVDREKGEEEEGKGDAHNAARKGKRTPGTCAGR